MKNRRISLLPLGIIIAVILTIISTILDIKSDSSIWSIILGGSGLIICIIAAEVQLILNRKWENDEELSS